MSRREKVPKKNSSGRVARLARALAMLTRVALCSLSAEEDVSLASSPNDAEQMGKRPKEPETGARLGRGGKL